MFKPGTVTTSNTLYALLGILRFYPEIQEAMVDEIDAMVGQDSRVTLDHKDSLHYTRAVILELLRYSSVVALGIPRKTLKDTELCGTPVPAGTNVSGQPGIRE